MKLYVCYDFLKNHRGGHPCGNAHVALKEAGHQPEVEAVHGFRLPPFNRTSGRDEVERLSGQRTVPVLVTDDGGVISGSKEIVAWAHDNPQPVATA